MDSREDWIKLQASGGISDAAWNGVRRLLLQHVFPSLHQMRQDSQHMLTRFADRLRAYQTFSEFEFSMPEMTQVLVMSNLIKFCTGVCALPDNVFVLFKLLMNSFIVSNLHIRHLVTANLNVGLLPINTSVMMTDLLGTDKERRDQNP